MREYVGKGGRCVGLVNFNENRGKRAYTKSIPPAPRMTGCCGQ